MKQIPRAYLSDDILKILDFSNYSDFKNSVDSIAETSIDLLSVRRLVISGSTIDNFDFLKCLPSLEQLSFLGCQSNKWSELKGNENISSLRLHNLKQGKLYLPSIAFVSTFPNLQYLYLNMLGIDNLSELLSLQYLHALYGVCCDTNNVKKPFDYSALEFLPRLKIFNTWTSVDSRRIPAENLIPVLKNPSVSRVSVSQMFQVEDRKLKKLIEEINPHILQPTRTEELNEIAPTLKKNFAW